MEIAASAAIPASVVLGSSMPSKNVARHLAAPPGSRSHFGLLTAYHACQLRPTAPALGPPLANRSNLHFNSGLPTFCKPSKRFRLALKLGGSQIPNPSVFLES